MMHRSMHSTINRYMVKEIAAPFTLGLVAFELMAYMVFVKRFPILAGMAPAAPGPAPADAARLPAAGR